MRRFAARCVCFFSSRRRHTRCYRDWSSGVCSSDLETQAGIKTIVIFSDMQEELGKGTVRDFPIKLDGIRIVALNVTKLGTDNADPRIYLDRLARWGARVRKAGATEWVVVNDLENNMESILNTR